ncbi:MAG: hypothetical protein PHC64_00010 [Candidatus Gastranaerophilales bacterium]|nr:hypothetical protein [Candidatus Gastranaerophilales bacterium]
MNQKIFSILLCLSMSLPVCAAKLEGNVKKQTIPTPVQEQEMTLGNVQRQIKIGTSQDEVALALGSPNIVTRDSDGKDTWIYDKVASITSYSDSGFGVGAAGGGLGGGINGGGGGILGIGYKKNKGQIQSVQKTLTVVIKFDKTNKVESFTYHMSKF